MQTGARTPLSGANLRDWVIAAHDRDRLASFDGVEQVRECREASVSVIVFIRPFYLIIRF